MEARSWKPLGRKTSVAEAKMRGLTDLAAILATLDPELLPEEYVFASLPGAKLADIAPLEPIGGFQEPEGLTVILTRENAVQHALTFALTLRCITLHAHSDLAAVGLTAVFSTRLAEESISANIVSGFFHDHIFVPAVDAERALRAIQSLQNSARSA
jgi:uncharacterized protein